MPLKRITTFYPAFDKRNPDPSKNYGVGGVTLRMVVKGKKGAVQFVLLTSWNLPNVQAELDKQPINQFPYMFHKPVPSDLGYHSPVPLYEGQTKTSKKCEYLGNKPCYYDGSTLNAEPIFEVLLREGSDGVWRELENYYFETFGQKE